MGRTDYESPRAITECSDPTISSHRVCVCGLCHVQSEPKRFNVAQNGPRWVRSATEPHVLGAICCTKGRHWNTNPEPKIQPSVQQTATSLGAALNQG